MIQHTYSRGRSLGGPSARTWGNAHYKFQWMSVCCCSPQLQGVWEQFWGCHGLRLLFQRKEIRHGSHRLYISINLSKGLSVKSHFPVPCSYLELTRVVPCAKGLRTSKCPVFTYLCQSIPISANEMMFFHCSGLLEKRLGNKFLRITPIYSKPLQIREWRWRWTLDICVVDTFDSWSFAAF